MLLLPFKYLLLCFLFLLQLIDIVAALVGRPFNESLVFSLDIMSIAISTFNASYTLRRIFFSSYDWSTDLLTEAAYSLTVSPIISCFAFHLYFLADFHAKVSESFVCLPLPGSLHSSFCCRP